MLCSQRHDPRVLGIKNRATLLTTQKALVKACSVIRDQTLHAFACGGECCHLAPLYPSLFTALAEALKPASWSAPWSCSTARRNSLIVGSAGSGIDRLLPLPHASSSVSVPGMSFVSQLLKPSGFARAPESVPRLDLPSWKGAPHARGQLVAQNGALVRPRRLRGPRVSAAHTNQGINSKAWHNTSLRWYKPCLRCFGNKRYEISDPSSSSQKG